MSKCFTLGRKIQAISRVELNPQQIDSMKAQGAYGAYMQSETLRVVRPYLVLGVIAVFWAFLIFRTKFPTIQSEHEAQGEDHGRFLDLFRYRHFLLAVVAQFMYVGAQVGTWSYFIHYVQESTHQPEKVAGYFLTGTLGAFGVGRFTSAYLMKFVAPNKLLGTYALVNIALVAVGVFSPGWVGLWALFLTSFFMSAMFPTIFALGLKKLGPNMHARRLYDTVTVYYGEKAWFGLTSSPIRLAPFRFTGSTRICSSSVCSDRTRDTFFCDHRRQKCGC